MGQVAPRTIADRVAGFSDGIVSDLLANLRLEPSNYLLNWRMDSLNDHNDPDNFGDGIILPEKPDGLLVYVTQPGGGRNTLSSQFTTKLPIEESYVDLDVPIVSGASPVSRQFAAQIAEPEFPVDYLTAVTSSVTGLEAGVYGVAFTYIENGFGPVAVWMHSKMSPSLSVTVGQGQHILITLPADIPEGVDSFGIWATEADGSTLRLQGIWGATRAGQDIILTGPYVREGDEPYVSELVYKPKAPTVRYAPGDDEGVPGIYRVAVRRIDLSTGQKSKLSDWSPWIELSETDIENNIAIEVDPEGAAFTSNFVTNYQYKLFVQRTDPITGEIEEYEYVNPDGAGGTTILEMEASLGPVQAGRDSGGRMPRISGRTERQRRKGGRPKARTGALRRKRKGITSTAAVGSTSNTATPSATVGPAKASLASASPGSPLRAAERTGTVSSSVESEIEEIEDPTSPLENAVGIGKTLPTPGPYKVGIAYTVGEQVTILSELQDVTITSGQVIRVWFPPGINRLYNQQWRVEASNGSLSGWTMTGANGTANQGNYSVDPITGNLNLSTGGLKNSFPTQSTPVFNQYLYINQAETWTFGAEFNATIIAGSVELYVEEYNESDSLVRTTPIKTTSVSIDSSFSLTLGPGYTAWHASTNWVRVGIRFTGSSRNATVDVKELYGMVWERRLRRRLAPKPLSHTHSNTEPKAFVGWEKAATKGIEIPPQRFRTPPGFAPIETMNFEGNALNAGWTLRQPDGTSGVTAAINTTAALSGTYGYQFSKTASGWRSQWLEKQFPPNTRSTLAIHFAVKITTRPTRDYVALVAFKDTLNVPWDDSLRAGIYLGSAGDLWLLSRDPGGVDLEWLELANGIKSGDKLDIELVGRGLNDDWAQYQAAVGVNGATRTFSKWIWGEVNAVPNCVYVGPYEIWDSGSTYSFYYDNINVTESGDLLSTPLTGTSTDPLPLPDRPYTAPVIEDNFTLEDGLMPTSANAGTVGTQRNPTDATKTIAVNTGAAIEGTYGMRVQDTGTGTHVYFYQSLPGTTSGGWRTKYRVDALPSSGVYRIMNIVNNAGTTMMAYDLSSTGELRAIIGTSGGEQTPVVVRTGIVASSRLTLEITFTGALSTSGTANFWHHYGATDGAAETSLAQRSLYRQVQAINWSTWAVDQFRVGATSKTVTAATINLRLDGIMRTEAGEVVLSEVDSRGNPIYQVNYFLPQNSPLRDDLMVQNVRIAVTPGKQYTFAVRIRCDGVLDYAYPFEITAFDIFGNEEYMGEVFDRVGGCIGTMEWADQYLEFIVPDNCYEVRINSRQLGVGEWTFQDPAFCPGIYEDVIRDVIYPESGEHRLILNTETEGELLWLQPDFDRPWITTRAIGTVPEGTTLTAEIAPRENKIPPLESEWKDPAALSMLERKKYAHYRITMTSNPDQSVSPELAAGTPYLDFFARLAGEPVPTLLRGDFSEFYGGAYVQDIDWPKPRHREYDVKKPQGRLIRHKLTEPIGRFNHGFTIVAFTQRAMEEIEDTFLDEEFGLEYLGQRFLIKFADPAGTEFTVDALTRRWVGEEWFARGTAPSGDEVEIVSEDNLPGNWRNA